MLAFLIFGVIFEVSLENFSSATNEYDYFGVKVFTTA